MPDDEKCLPWNLSETRATTISVAMLKVPPNARGEYEKACDALNKNKFNEAEKRARGAIAKYQSYSAAWVMLGLTLEEQKKAQEAGDACSQAVTIDPTYVPGYFCKAEFAVRAQDWKQVLDLATLAMGLKAEGNAYSYYYQATAYLHLNNLAEAKKSAQQAVEFSVNRSDPSLCFLLAQIYDREGDTANAIGELQMILKNHSDHAKQEAARQYLAELESQQTAK